METIYLDPNHYRVSGIIDMIQCNVDMQARLNLVKTLDATFGVDGNHYFYLYGDLPTGVTGFGETPDKALIDFWNNWHNQKINN